MRHVPMKCSADQDRRGSRLQTLRPDWPKILAGKSGVIVDGFWCTYNFKVVGQIPTGTDLRGMYGIGLTCGVASALKQEGFQDFGIRKQGLDNGAVCDMETDKKKITARIVTFIET